MNNIIILLLFILSIVNFVIVGSYNFISILTIITFIFLLFVPKIFSKFVSKRIEFWYLFFLVLAYFLGIIFDLYKIISWYDSFVHFISGIFGSFIAVFIYLKFNNTKEKIFGDLFVFSFSMMIAGLWEILEFFLSNLLGVDMQNVLTTGINDTMKDIVCALLGTIILIVFRRSMINCER